MAAKSRFNRDNILMVSACITLVASVAFAAAGFVVSPVGEIHDSVLWMCAQFLLYTGSALGIATYMQSKFIDIRRDLKIHKEDEQ